MFDEEVVNQRKWKNEGGYREATSEEIEKLIPHLTTGKGFSGMLNIKEKMKKIDF